MNENNQATPHCASTINKALLALPISRLHAATAATHGVYNKVNIKNDAALAVVNKLPKTVGKAVDVVFNKTVSVDTTASLAVKPVINAVAARQSPKPSGAKTGAITRPTLASILNELSSTTFNLASKLCKNQMMIDARNIIVNAFVRKSLALSHINKITLLALGRR